MPRRNLAGRDFFNDAKRSRAAGEVVGGDCIPVDHCPVVRRRIEVGRDFLGEDESEGGVEEKQPTILRLGDATLNVLFEPDDEDQKAFLERLVNRELVTCRIVFPDGENYLEFQAYIAGFEPGEITTDGLLEATITLAATAKPSFGKES